MTKQIQHRGYTIQPVKRQGVINYIVPALDALGSKDQAASVKAAKRWIDLGIATKELASIEGGAR